MIEKGTLEMLRKIRRYTQEFKDEAVKLALGTSSVGQAAHDLGVPVSTLHSWISQSKLLILDPDVNDSGPQSKINMSQLLEKNRELQKRVNRLEQEKSILKKAAMYFAKEIGVTTDSEHNHPVFANILDRDFSANAINQKWAGYIWQLL